MIEDRHVPDLLPGHRHVLQELQNCVGHVLQGSGKRERGEACGTHYWIPVGQHNLHSNAGEDWQKKSAQLPEYNSRNMQESHCKIQAQGPTNPLQSSLVSGRKFSFGFGKWEESNKLLRGQLHREKKLKITLSQFCLM